MPAFVIAVAADPDERARIARHLDGTPMLLVERPEDAVQFLAAGPEAVPEPEPHPVVCSPPPDLAGLTIDSDGRFAACNGKRVALSPLEHDLLRSLCDDLGHVLTFDWLQQHVWGNDHPGNRSHVQSLVKRLRRKLHKLGTPLQIDAVRGVGLRLVPAGSGPAPDDVA